MQCLRPANNGASSSHQQWYLSCEWLVLHLPCFLFNWFFFPLVELGPSPWEESFGQLTREDFQRWFVSLPAMDLSSLVFANSIDPFSLEAIYELGNDRWILTNDTSTVCFSGMNFLQFIKKIWRMKKDWRTCGFILRTLNLWNWIVTFGSSAWLQKTIVKILRCFFLIFVFQEVIIV